MLVNGPGELRVVDEGSSSLLHTRGMSSVGEGELRSWAKVLENGPSVAIMSGKFEVRGRVLRVNAFGAWCGGVMSSRSLSSGLWLQAVLKSVPSAWRDLRDQCVRKPGLSLSM